MLNKVKVEFVTEAPAIGKPEMQSGIRTKEAAEAWAEKNGYTQVFFWKARERVYADKLTKRVDVLAQQLHTKSQRLVSFSEKGHALIEMVLWTALVLFVLIYVCKDWAW